MVLKFVYLHLSVKRKNHFKESVQKISKISESTLREKLLGRLGGTVRWTAGSWFQLRLRCNKCPGTEPHI